MLMPAFFLPDCHLSLPDAFIPPVWQFACATFNSDDKVKRVIDQKFSHCEPACKWVKTPKMEGEVFFSMVGSEISWLFANQMFPATNDTALKPIIDWLLFNFIF